MTFSEFAKTLYSYCGGGMKTSDFVLSLIANIMENPSNEADEQKAADDKYNPLANLSVSALEKTYSGGRPISKKNASAVLSHLDKEKFVDYINVLPIDTISSLSKALRGNEVDVDKFPSGCADILTGILEECANGAKNTVSIWKTTEPFLYETSDEPVPDLTGHLQTIPKSDLYLLMEANSSCPSCGKPLISDKNNSSLARYKVTHIVPTLPTKDQKTALGELLDSSADKNASSNKIALCLDCANSYISLTTRDECIKLMDTKDKLHRNYVAVEALDKMYLEEQIEAVLRQIPSASQEQLSDTLSYDALRIREKISGSNVPLIIKTESFVVPYYKYIESVFSQLEREGVLNFEDVSNDVLRSYRKLHSGGLTQDEIYAQLVN